MLLQSAIAFDQLLNTFFGGYADETLSARAYRLRNKGWERWYKVFNTVFFWQENHCKAAYDSELERKHLPKDYRGS